MWKPIDGHPGYEVSDKGEVWSHKTGKALLPSPNWKGYLRVAFYTEGKTHFFTVHRLVAQAFIPNPDNLLQVNHKDFDPTNNAVTNLEWASHQDNIDHSAENVKRGQDHYMAKLTETDVLDMRWLRSLGVAVADLADSYGVAKRTARDAIRGITWRHI